MKLPPDLKMKLNYAYQQLVLNDTVFSAESLSDHNLIQIL